MPHCPSCGTDVREGARFCPGCGVTVASPAPATTPWAAGKAAAPGAAKQPMFVAAPAPPPPPVAGPPPPGPRVAPIALAAGVVVALLVIGVGAFLLAGEDPAQNETATQGAGPNSDGDATDPTSRSTAATTSPRTPPQTAADPSAPRGMSGTWIAVLISYRTQEEAQAYLPQAPPGSQVLRTDDYSSLRAGYWIVYHDGGFRSGREAADFCLSVGRTTPQECFARFLTTDPDAGPTDPDLNVDP